MTLEMLLEDRDIWQKNTIKKIKDRLLNKSEVSFEAKEEKLVVIYGLTQVGKTTLILNLMGISGDKLDKIYKILRTGIPHGNSSTSTAIIYQRSQDDSYKMGYKQDGHISEVWTYEREEDFVERLKVIRQEVESGRAAKDILYIYIPCFYFDERSVKHANISILDLPGDGSQNLNENPHINMQIRKYMSLAAVNIIACKADFIQSLESLQVPGNWDWKYLNHRYILVITSSYGEGNIKTFFRRTREQRGSFLEYVENHYKKELEKVLGSDCQIECFPVDIGDSLNKLCNEELRDYPEADRMEVLKAAEIVTDKLRDSIQRRRGNGLKAAIEDLEKYSLKLSMENLRNKKQQLVEIEQKINRTKDDVYNCNEKLQLYKQEIEIRKPLYNEYLRMKEVYRSLTELKEERLPLMVESVMENLISETESNFRNDGILSDNVDKDRVSCKFRKMMEEATENLLHECGSDFEEFSLFRRHGAESEAELASTLYYEIQNSCTPNFSELERFLYSRNSQDRLLKRIFFKRKRNECMNMLRKCTDAYLEKMWNRVFLEMENMLKDQEDIQLTHDMYVVTIHRKLENKAFYETQLEELESKKAGIESEIRRIENRKKTDEDTLRDYRVIAKEEYEFQTQSIKKYMESYHIGGTDLLCYITYLALLERDYNQIIGNGGEI